LNDKSFFQSIIAAYGCFDAPMTKDSKDISISELKRLLYELHDKHAYTCIRFRLLGEMWQKNFLRIFSINDDTVIFSDETSGRLLKVTDLMSIMQFELDHNFQQFIAYYHYAVSMVDAV
jgi:hypothetical protein